MKGMGGAWGKSLHGEFFDLDGRGAHAHEDADVEVDGEREDGLDVSPVASG